MITIIINMQWNMTTGSSIFYLIIIIFIFDFNNTTGSHWEKTRMETQGYLMVYKCS